MNWRDTFSQFGQFGTNPLRLRGRGLVLLCAGALLASASLLNPNAMLMHATEFSWLPAAAWVLLLVGLAECLDAVLAKESRDFFMHLPAGLLDVIVGGLALFSISGNPDRLNLMVAAFLMSKGMMRVVITYGTRLANRTAMLTGAWVSIVLGVVVGVAWPTTPAWFLSFCLSAEIASRGWALMVFAAWLKEQRLDAQA